MMAALMVPVATFCLSTSRSFEEAFEGKLLVMANNGNRTDQLRYWSEVWLLGISC